MKLIWIRFCPVGQARVNDRPEWGTLPRERSAPNFSFTLSPLPSKKAGFWQRRGRRSRSAGSSRRPSRRGSRLPFPFFSDLAGTPPRPHLGPPEVPIAAPRGPSLPQRRELGTPQSRTAKLGPVRAAGGGRGARQSPVGMSPRRSTSPSGGGDVACVAAVWPQPVGPLPSSLLTLTGEPPPTTKKPKTNKQQPLSHIWDSKPAWPGVGPARRSPTRRDWPRGVEVAAPCAPRPLEGAQGSRRWSGVRRCSPQALEWKRDGAVGMPAQERGRGT